MALVVKDRVRETTTTTGTGTVTLAGAVAGFQSFSVIGNGNTTYYTITNNVDWEVGIGTYTSSGTTLSRDTILESSNGGAAVNFGAGTKDVFVTYPAEKAVYYDASDNVGIGTSSPGVKLDVQGSGSVYARARSLDTTGGTIGYVGAEFAGGSALQMRAGLGYTYLVSTGASDPLLFGTNSTERMRIDSSGNVGIGTTSPPLKLSLLSGVTTNNVSTPVVMLGSDRTDYYSSINSVRGSASTYIGLAFSTSNNAAPAEAMRIDPSGNVGIGTSSPSSSRRLVLNGSGASAAATSIQLATSTSGVGNSDGFTLELDGVEAYVWNYENATMRFGTNNSERMRIDSSGNVSIGTTTGYGGYGSGKGLTLSNQSSLIFQNASNTWNSTTAGGAVTYFSDNNMYIDAKDSGSNVIFRVNGASERMRIDSSGNVGIGTSSPAQKLHAATTAAPSGTTQSFLRLTGGATYGADFGGGLIQGTGPIATISTVNNGTPTERIRIDGSGNVGIGTSSPLFELDTYKTKTGVVNIAVGNAVGAANDGARFNLHYGGTSIGSYGYTWDGGAFYNTLDFYSDLRFTRQGSEKVRIDSSGNLLVGTTSAIGKITAYSASNGDVLAAFRCVGTGTQRGLYVSADNSTGVVSLDATGAAAGILAFKYGGTEAMRIDTSGNVGIGNSSPLFRLDTLFNSNVYVGMKVQNQSTNQFAGSGLAMCGPSAGAGASIYYYNSNAGGTVGAVSLNRTDNAGNYQATLFNYEYSGQAWQFMTNNTERMRIDSSGRVGIGTSVPSALLDVRSAAGTDSQIANRAGNAAYMVLQGTSFPNFNQVQSYDGSGNLYWSIGGSGTANTLAFLTNGSNERMRIDSSGNVGIGTSSPTSRLTITGGVTEIRDGNYLMLRPSGNGWDMRLQATGTQLDILSGGALGSPIMSLVNGGNVGIGTSSPGKTLDLVGQFRASSAAGSGYALLEYGTSGTASNNWHVGSEGDGTFRWYNGNFGAGTERMRITSAGNVGIGTSSPGVKLDVAGSVRVSNTSSVQFRNAAGTAVAYMTLQSDDNFVVYNAAGTPISSFTQGATNFAIYGSNASNRMQVDSLNNVTSWTVNGSERARIGSNGGVAIGGTGTDASLHIQQAVGGYNRLTQMAPSGTSKDAFNIMAAKNSGGTDLWWSWGVDTSNRWRINQGVGFSTNGLIMDDVGQITSADQAAAVGYKGLPQNAQTATYTLALSDMGKHISITTGGITVPANASVAFPIGATIVIFNNSASSQNIAITTDTMYLAGTATTGTRTLAQRGLATVVKVASTTWVISGSGVT